MDYVTEKSGKSLYLPCFIMKHLWSLLRLNERALVLLSLLEQAAQQNRPIGLPFIRGRLTSLSIQVYKIILELNRLADHRYAELFDTFQRIQQSVQAVLAPLFEEASGPFIRFIHTLSKDDAENAFAGLSRRIEDCFGSPQDVEWALDRSGKVSILQARPRHP
jgi:hypothetical protein